MTQTLDGTVRGRVNTHGTRDDLWGTANTRDVDLPKGSLVDFAELGLESVRVQTEVGGIHAVV